VALAPGDGRALALAKSRPLGRCEQYKAARADKMSASQLRLNMAVTGYRCASRFNRLCRTIGALSGFGLGSSVAISTDQIRACSQLESLANSHYSDFRLTNSCWSQRSLAWRKEVFGRNLIERAHFTCAKGGASMSLLVVRVRKKLRHTLPLRRLD